jgi:hypothetical protein
MPEELKNRRLNVPNKTKLRNLIQYKGLTDDQFDDMYAKKSQGINVNKEFEERIARKIEEFGVDYDVDDLNSNDKLVLRALAQAMITLDDFEHMSYNMRVEQDGITEKNILVLDKIGNFMSNLRRDISRLQDDLKITRRAREADKTETVISFIQDLQKKAKEFYAEKMSYILCPKCGMLLATVWTLYPTEDKNKITLVCNRPNEDGKGICGEKFTVTTKELLESRGTNRKELLPESMR